jgi:hypothetical protein
MLIFLKMVFTFIILFVGLALFTLGDKALGFGALPLAIISIATLAGLTAVWKYKRKEKETNSDLPKLDKSA